MTQCRFSHLSGSNDQHAFAIQRSENFTRQFDRGVADGNSAFPDIGFRTHALGDVERARHHQVQESAKRAAFLGGGVGTFKLAENLRLADDHGIEA